ncbi:hypothetical protein K431DRAFT_310508 [Polychaeton citri CBS 116435]|uniref:G-patch domain-containing protein n=1 Tax=Polychaeton citri CBS 116435 TaxID=1314669 RepID=A0A9P4USK8_9PEZI|nr:hypothetical protein K431DRAFT_310508 [Polychaeton citri CBS 116435]
MDEDEYEIPLRDQRYFGAGIKRKRVQFVPSSSSTQEPAKCLPKVTTQTAADRYLSIVFKKNTDQGHEIDRSGEKPPLPTQNPAGGRDLGAVLGKAVSHLPDTETIVRGETSAVAGDRENVCEICMRSVKLDEQSSRHSSSIAHQICLQHSHPPNHIDRKRKGLAILESQNWDPDSRRGLGAEGEGILQPIKAKEKNDRAGLGAVIDTRTLQTTSRPKTLDAGKVKDLEIQKRMKREQLSHMFYGNDDVAKYLGSEGGGGDVS